MKRPRRITSSLYAKGLLKVLSKMGISTIRSYRGAKLFEAVGLSEDLAANYFGGISSKVGGIGFKGNYRGCCTRIHEAGYEHRLSAVLEHKVYILIEKDGEKHAWNPETISALQLATRLGSYKKFKEYTKLVDEKEEPLFCVISWISNSSRQFLWRK